MKESTGGEINYVIALKKSKVQKDINENDCIIRQINNISNEFNNKVFIFCIETGENIYDMFYDLGKQLFLKWRKYPEIIRKN